MPSTTPAGGVTRKPPETCSQLDLSLRNSFASPSRARDSTRLGTSSGRRLRKNHSVFPGVAGRFVKYASGRLSPSGVAVNSPHGFAKLARPEAGPFAVVVSRPNH